MGIPHGAAARACHQADPRQLRRGRLGARPSGAGAQDREPGGVLQAGEGGMSTPEERLADMGLSVPKVAKPVASYIPVVRTGSYVFSLVQLPIRDGQLISTGKVGGEVYTE